MGKSDCEHLLWELFKENRQISCTYVESPSNEIADMLAKKGKLQGHPWSYTGFTFPTSLA